MTPLSLTLLFSASTRTGETLPRLSQGYVCEKNNLCWCFCKLLAQCFILQRIFFYSVYTHVGKICLLEFISFEHEFTLQRCAGWGWEWVWLLPVAHFSLTPCSVPSRSLETGHSRSSYTSYIGKHCISGLPGLQGSKSYLTGTWRDKIETMKKRLSFGENMSPTLTLLLGES